MSNSFLPPQPIQDREGRIRNGLLIGLVIFMIGSGITGRLFVASLSDSDKEALNEVLPVPVFEPTQQVGGDLVVPPKELRPVRPERIGPLPAEEQFSAKAIIVKDLESGALLYNRNAYTPRPIASLTKLMSALVVLEKDIDWATTTTVIGADSLGTHMYAGDTYTLEQLWQAGLVASSNKAIMTLANALDWPEQAVVERMRQKAQELGMTHASFSDTTGLDAGNTASASDVAILLDEALAVDAIRETLLIPEVTLYSNERNTSHHMYSTNWLLLGWIQHDFAEIVGGKTGYTPAAGYNFAFQVYDTEGNGVSVVVLGTESHEARFTEARDIAMWAFENHKWPEHSTP